MKYGILSDLHGNQYALKQVLSFLKSNNVNQLLILGDFVGYYYGIKDILKMLKPWNLLSIRGNHEQILKEIFLGKANKVQIISKYGSAHYLAIKELADSEIQYLITLPKTIEISIGSNKVLLCHSNPWLGKEYIYPDTNIKTLLRFGDLSYDYIFFGHSHYPFSFKVKNTVCINPGSVGQPRDKYSLPSVLIFNSENEVFSFHKIPFNKKLLLSEIKLIDPNHKHLTSVLER